MSGKNKSKPSPSAQQQVVQKSAKAVKGPTAPKTDEDYKVKRGSARALRRAGLVKGWRNTTGAKQMLPPAGVTSDNAEDAAA